MLMSASPSTSPQFELQLMGGFGLRCRGHSPDPIIISSKKARALLAYVAMQEPMRVGREQLATLLWPERIDRQARQNLRACLASLRDDLAGLADDVLAINAESVGIKAMRVDARELRALGETNAASELEDAESLYRGPFLSDLALEGEALYAWASAERTRLDADAGTVLSMLVGRAEDAGDAGRATALAARLVVIDPFREDWLRLSLRVTARHLGRDKALLQARDFVDLLKKELDVAPEPATVALIELLKAGGGIAAGYSDVAFAAPNGKTAPPLFSPDRIAAQPGQLPARRGDRRPVMTSAIVAAALALLIAALAVSYQSGLWGGSLKPGMLRSASIDDTTIPLLISPFQAQQADAAALAAAMTENVLASVSRFSGLTVIDGRALQAPDSATGSGYWGRGAVSRQGLHILVHAGLTDLTERTVVWAADYAGGGNAGDADGVIARRIARDFQVQAAYAAARGLDDTKLALAPLHQLVAKALTIQYRSLTADDDAAAAAMYEEILRREPHSPLALIGLAARLVETSANLLCERQSALARAEALIQQALQVDPRIERGHYWLGDIYLQRELALKTFDRALKLNPSFVPAEAHAGFAMVLAGQAAAGLGRIDHALTEGMQDPNERLWLRFAGIARLELGDDQPAIGALQQAAALGPPAPPLRAALASAYALIGDRAQSREQFELLKQAADPVALEQLLGAAKTHQGSRYWQGLRLAAGDTL
jgi:DNA-binding SARP family transcriptional activator/TolB-like protein/Tfp pilus assembly protein PilF